MISPSYFVSASHLAPESGNQLTFHLDNSSTGATYVGTVDGTWSYQGNVDGLPSDLYVGRLTTPIPAAVGVAMYPILDLPNPLTDYHNAELWVYGFRNYPNDVVGRNLVNNPSGYADVELAYTNTAHTAATAILIYNYDVGPVYPSVGAAEAKVQEGDSGAPLFISVGSQLAVVGTHFAINGNLEYDTFVPYYTSQILAAIQASNRPEPVMVIVPEPGALLLLLLGGGYWGTRRRFHRRGVDRGLG